MCPTSSVSPLHASLTLEGFRGLPQKQKGQISRNTAVYLCMLRTVHRLVRAQRGLGQAQDQLMDEVNFLGGQGSWLRRTSDLQMFSVVVKQYGSTAFNSYKYLCIRLQSIEHLCNSGQTNESAIHSMCNVNSLESSVNDKNHASCSLSSN